MEKGASVLNVNVKGLEADPPLLGRLQNTSNVLRNSTPCGQDHQRGLGIVTFRSLLPFSFIYRQFSRLSRQLYHVHSLTEFTHPWDSFAPSLSSVDSPRDSRANARSPGALIYTCSVVDTICTVRASVGVSGRL